MRRREQLSPHDVLGVSPTCEPELIDAAYQALTRKYRGDESEHERVRSISAAYARLKGPQSQREQDAPPAAAAPLAGTEMWLVRPRGRPGDRPEDRPGDRAELRPPAIAPSPEPLFAPPAACVASQADGQSARHWSVSDWSNEPPDSLPPADEPVADPRADDQFAWSRHATPLAAGLGVIGAVLLTTILTDRLPDPSPVEVSRDAALPPPAKSVVRTLQRGTEAQVDTKTPEADAIAKVGEHRGPLAPASQQSIAPAKIESQAASTAITPRPAPQSARSSPPDARSIPASAMSVALSPAPDETKPAPRVQPELPLQQAAEQQPALAAPARWISGGLEDSDNRKGRFAGAVAVRITVGPDGRAGGCRIAQSSGNPALDQTTCRLLGERLRFSPARDATGRSVTSEVGTTYVWGRRLRR